MMQTDVMRHRIEESRQLLHQLGNQYGLLHPKVLKQSMALDELLNRYYRAIRNKDMKPIA
ncbi:aspartyl-phosphate phosphatase Spo0E family protein [Paenibacillus sp. DMB20]|uniref:aspartyl-phosphate phosphatase Spo0E family protein n=1 Tax=Paenibacillus sp. DMB20 TaxID=1642570 RepID=UPI0006279A4B|nr:aspartyl-phosphate phosphatase Spo0E family protein [Paenibacillus sp. DMB20]KKO54052.1 hypothetical protein XI25_08090 [Paenibacillus sp. DMB20]